jgi:bacillithiol biosynthesis deacetylase BshB1
MSALDLLAFGPHPDDVELFCGGLLADAARRGHRAGVVDLTRGEMASRGTPETRAAETEAASRELGLAHRENLGLPDAGVRVDDASVALVVEALRRLRPEIVVAPYWSERHPDHEAASALVTRALFLAGLRKFGEGEPHAPRQVLYYPMRHLAEPSFVVDTTGVHARKMAAVRCYGSQVLAQAGAPATLVGSALSLSSLEARDAFYGAQIGVAFGEPYVVRETLGLADPLDHFRRNHFGGKPLYFPERR